MPVSHLFSCKYKIYTHPNCGSGCSRTIEEAIRDAGREEILFVTAGDNATGNLDANQNSRQYPVCYTLGSIIGVTRTDYDDHPSGKYGATSIDLGAPGVGICSTIPRQRCTWNLCEEPPCDPLYNCTAEATPYDENTGTSMAAPHVAGVAALLRAVKPGIPALSIKARILNNVDVDPDPNGLLRNRTLTGGPLNAYKAIYPEETAAPNPVTDLTAQSSPPRGVTLTWPAPSDGESEPVVFYDLRYSTSSITAENFGTATRFWDVATPLAPGQSQTTTVTNLTAYTTYYFAMKAVDDWGNTSSISGVVSAQTCNLCTVSFCKPWGDDLFARCTWTNTCGPAGCCIYSCVVDSTCSGADDCPPHACWGACE